MKRKLVARMYGAIGLIITTIFAILLSILGIESIQSKQLIGFSVIGLATGLITILAAVNLYRINDEITTSSRLITRSIIQDLLAAAAISILISLLILGIYEEGYAQRLIQDYSPLIFVTVAVVHFLLNHLARK